jgi:hypothetical protein
MNPQVPHDGEYPDELRTALVDWAFEHGAPGLTPPDVVREYLQRAFGEATRRGRERGLRQAALVVIPALILLVVAVRVSGGVT